MDSTFFIRFPKQLGFWMLHGILNSLPGLIMAFLVLEPGKSGCMAMLAGIAVLVVAFAVVTSRYASITDGKHMLSRSLRLGLTIRMWVVAVSVYVLLCAGKDALIVIPDMYCGLAAALSLGAVEQALGIRSWHEFFDAGGFAPVFIATLLSGFMICLQLLMISFFCVIFLQGRERKKLLKAARVSEGGVMP